MVLRYVKSVKFEDGLRLCLQLASKPRGQAPVALPSHYVQLKF